MKLADCAARNSYPSGLTIFGSANDGGNGKTVIYTPPGVRPVGIAAVFVRRQGMPVRSRFFLHHHSAVGQEQHRAHLKCWLMNQTLPFACREPAYVPVTLDSSTREAIRFPVKATGYGSAGKLFERVINLVNVTSGSRPASYVSSHTGCCPRGSQSFCPRRPSLSSLDPQDKEGQRRPADMPPPP